MQGARTSASTQATTGTAARRSGAAATTRTVAGGPLGPEGSRHAGGLLAAGAGHARHHQRSVGNMRRQGGPHLLWRQRQRPASVDGQLPGHWHHHLRRADHGQVGNDTTLRTTQPAVSCTPTRAQWTGPPNALNCRRVSDTLALCRDGLNFEYEFRRE